MCKACRADPWSPEANQRGKKRLRQEEKEQEGGGDQEEHKPLDAPVDIYNVCSICQALRPDDAKHIFQVAGIAAHSGPNIFTGAAATRFRVIWEGFEGLGDAATTWEPRALFAPKALDGILKAYTEAYRHATFEL